MDERDHIEGGSEQEDQNLSEEEEIFNQILKANSQRLEFEKNGDYIQAGELKKYLKGLGELYENKCIENLQKKHE